MNWYHHDETVDKLASAYVLGTLTGRARQRFETAMGGQPGLQTAVAAWTRRLAPLLLALAPVQPSPQLWPSIARITVSPAAATLPWWQRWIAPLPAGALAFGLVLGTLVPWLWQAQRAMTDSGQVIAQLPASYVGVLATAGGQPGLIVSSLRHARVVDIKQVTPVPVPAGFDLYLWRIDKAGVIAPLGPLPQGAWVQLHLDETAEQVFAKAQELAVSIEPQGSRPALPGQAFVYRGLCAKLWK